MQISSARRLKTQDGEWKEKPQSWLLPVKNDWHLEMRAGICSVVTVGRKRKFKGVKGVSESVLPFVC